MIKLKSILTEDVDQNKLPKTLTELFDLVRKKKIFTRWSQHMEDISTIGPYAYNSDVISWTGGLPAAEDFWEINFYFDSNSPDLAEISVRTTKLNKKPISALKSDFIRLNKTGDTTLHEYDVLPHLVADPAEYERFKYQYKLTTRISLSQGNVNNITKLVFEMIQQSFYRIVG